MDDKDMWEEQQEALHIQEEKLQGKISDLDYENYILNKVIDMMAEDLALLKIEWNPNDAREYYFKKARGEK